MRGVDFNESKMVWFGSDLGDARRCGGTYAGYAYESLPPLDPTKNPFKECVSLDDVEGVRHRVQESPTACYFRVDRSTGAFYRDQQDCIVWALDSDNGGVFVLPDDEDQDEEEGGRGNEGPEEPVVFVAKSMAEFLWRVHIENTIWFQLNSEPLQVEEPLASAVAAYLSHYQELKRKTRAAFEKMGCMHLDLWFNHHYIATSVMHLWKNAGFPHIGYMFVIDALSPSLSWSMSFFSGGSELSRESVQQIKQVFVECNKAGSAAAIAFLGACRKKGSISKDPACIIARMIFEGRFKGYIQMK